MQHTPNFEEFLEQYNSKGQFHLDGYSPSHFVDLTKEEQTQAFQMLEDSLFNENDSTAIYGLATLGKSNAMPVFERFYEKIGDEYAEHYAELHYWMYCISGDEKYFHRLLKGLNSESYFARQKAIRYLSDLPVSDNTEQIYDGLRQRIFVEIDSTCLHATASLALRVRGVNRGDPQFLSFIRQLTSDSAEEKKRALARLEASHPVLSV